MSTAEPQAIRFLLDGHTVSASGLPARLTLLQDLREEAGRTGTKEGCAEGDCGACTVVLGRLDGERVSYRAVNACIRLLAPIDGHELVTVESLQDQDCLHPVQQAMVDQHASQCGFCTPGFVMSLFALYLQSSTPAREQVIEALAGNLCRCTGYRPIVEAGCRMSEYPTPRKWHREASSSPQRVAALRQLQRSMPLRLPGFQAPRTLDELAAALEQWPDALLLAGGTDVGLWITKQLREPRRIVYLGEVQELRALHRDAHAFTIGAAVALTDAWAALVEEWPVLAEFAQRFGSPPVRNSATLGGNVANGSPIGDTMPVLIALGAQVQLRRGHTLRCLPLEELYVGYQQQARAPGEFVTALIVPRARPDQRLAAYKLSKRFEQDISSVSLGICVRLDGERVLEARIAYGGMAAVPARARPAEAALRRDGWCPEGIEAAARAVQQQFQPLTDHRASGAYRSLAAANLLRRFYEEPSGGQRCGVFGDQIAALAAPASAPI